MLNSKIFCVFLYSSPSKYAVASPCHIPEMLYRISGMVTLALALNDWGRGVPVAQLILFSSHSKDFDSNAVCA